MINILIFRCAKPKTLSYYYFANRATRKNPPDCPYDKKLSCLRFFEKKGEVLLPFYRNKTSAEVACL